MDHHPKACWSAEPTALGGLELAIMARSMLAARRALHRFVPSEMIHDPALDLLLHLFVAKLDQRSISAEELLTKTTTSGSTAKRWLLALKASDLVEISDDFPLLTLTGSKVVEGAIRAVAESQWHLDAV